MKFIFSLILAASLIGCSLPPERPVTEGELLPLLRAFEFEESPEEIAAVLNKNGEAVIVGKYRGRPYYIKILATSRGLVVEWQQKR